MNAIIFEVDGTLKVTMWVVKKHNIFLLLFLSVSFTIEAQIDSALSKTLQEITVVDKRSVDSDKKSGIQKMDSVFLESMPAFQLSDVLKRLSGVFIKDYGGVGGIKTVSVRSLGANHTAIAYDGFLVSDYQTGQINIGRFSIENIDEIRLTNANIVNIYQSARLLAAANILQLTTQKPCFDSLKKVNLKLSFRAGSFALLQPFVLIENKISKRVSTSFSAEYLYHKGNYPFQMQNGNNVIRERRQDSDMQLLRLKLAVYGVINDKQQLSTNVFYYRSEQGLPGAVIFYNTALPQRMWEENLFVQTHYENVVNKKFRFQSNVKWNYAFLRYLDSNYLNREREIDNHYWQREIYTSQVLLYNPIPCFSTSLSNDVSYSTMSTNMKDFVNPSRLGVFTALSALFEQRKISLSATILHNYFYDWNASNTAEKNTHKWTPAVQLSYQPIAKEEWYIRSSYKHVFRMPTFNDLYYRLVGDLDLRPENIDQVNFGLSFSKYLHSSFPYFSISTDVYYNQVKDKIVAIPNKNLFVWSMLNFGKVAITGVDVQVFLENIIVKHLKVETVINYTFQQSIDISDKNSKSYKHQIPYTPLHTASGIVALKTKYLNVSYSLLYTGKRYVLRQNIVENSLQPYTEHSIALYRSFKIKASAINLRFEILNLTNKQYEIIRNYPMAGRQYQGKIIYQF